MLTKRGKFYFGESSDDLRTEIGRYSRDNVYEAVHFADSVCQCGATSFNLLLDDPEGVAIRNCPSCGSSHPIADSAEYLDEAEPEECECPCGNGLFQLSTGLALYQDSIDVRWIYIGCRCLKCGLVAVYGDWKLEAEDFQSVLQSV